MALKRRFSQFWQRDGSRFLPQAIRIKGSTDGSLESAHPFRPDFNGSKVLWSHYQKEISSYQIATNGHKWTGWTTCFAERKRSAFYRYSALWSFKNRLKSAQGSVVWKMGQKKVAKILVLSNNPVNIRSLIFLRCSIKITIRQILVRRRFPMGRGDHRIVSGKNGKFRRDEILSSRFVIAWYFVFGYVSPQRMILPHHNILILNGIRCFLKSYSTVDGPFYRQ